MKYLLTLMCICCLATTAWAGDVVVTKKPMSQEERAKAIAARKPFVNSLGMEFLWVKPGPFLMGLDPNGLEYAANLDNPPFLVTLTQGIYLARFELTNAQWDKIMPEKARSLPNASFPTPPEHAFPNSYIEDAKTFVRRLNQREGKLGRYNLPTEAEWEYACKSGSDKDFWWGSDHLQLDDLSNIRMAYKPPGSYPPNHWGFYDMQGNVKEWVRSNLPWGFEGNSLPHPHRQYKNEVDLKGGDAWEGPLESKCGRRQNLSANDDNNWGGIRLAFYPYQ